VAGESRRQQYSSLFLAQSPFVSSVADDCAVPSDQQTGDLFKESVLQLARKDEENFQEAYNQAHLAYKKYVIPDEVERVVNDERAQNLTAQSPKFWIMVNAMKKFMDKEGEVRTACRVTSLDHSQCACYRVSCRSWVLFPTCTRPLRTL